MFPIAPNPSVESLRRRIRLALEVVSAAEGAVAAGDIPKATTLCRDADRVCIVILRELTQLSRREAELVASSFTELEVRLQQLSNALGTQGNQASSV